MRIVIVYDCEFPWDIRVEKLARTFTRGGNSVRIVARNLHRQPKEDSYNGIEVRRVVSSASRLLNGMLNITLFFNPVWLFTIWKNARGYDLIIVRDLPLAVAGIIVGRFLRIPVIIDMAEPYPLTLKQRRMHEPFRLHHLLIRNIPFALALEWASIRLADRIIVVCQEAADRLIYRGASEDRVVIVHNTPVLEELSFDQGKSPQLMESLRGRFVVLYVGFLIGGRGLEVAIEAVKSAVKKVPHLALVIAGSGKSEQALRRLVSQAGLENHVFFAGWLDHTRLPRYIASCDIGILPFHATDHINHTIANKFFDFFSLNKSIICSDAKPMRRLIEQIGDGYLFRAGDSDDLARLIVSVITEHRPTDAPAGKRAIQQYFNWSVDSSRLIDEIQRMMNQARRGQKSTMAESV